MITLIGTCGDYTAIEQGEAGAVGVLVNGPVKEDFLRLACLWGRQTGRMLAFLYLIVVPISLPITARLVPESTLAETRLRLALLIAHQYGCTATASALRARDAGRGIVEEAIHHKFCSLFLTASSSPEDAQLMTYLKEKAPCMVIVSILATGRPRETNTEGLEEPW